MKNFLKMHMPALVIACLIAATPAATFAEGQPNTDKIAYKTDYRAEGSYWNKGIREGRVIIDEMVVNKGADNILNEFNWSDLATRTSFGELWIHEQNKAEFNIVIQALRRTLSSMDTRAGHIQQIRFQIFSEQKTQKARWDKLIAGEKIQDQLLRALGIKVAGLTASKLFGLLGKNISNKLASGLAKGAGKIIGPVSTAISMLQFFKTSDEYFEMNLMLSRLLERAEMIAYLDVLLGKYDGILAAQETLISELEEAYTARAKSRCR